MSSARITTISPRARQARTSKAALTEAGRRHFIFEGMDSELDVHLGHFDHVDRTGRRALADGIQCHPRPKAGFQDMPYGVFFDVIDEHALFEALEAGTIAGAALDVYEQEPLPSDSPLRNAPRLVHTPHLGAATHEAQVGVAAEVSETLIHALAMGDVSEAINAASLA